MRPMFGLMKVIFTASASQQSVLLLENFTARNHIGGGGHANVERRERNTGAEHPRSDRAPAVKPLARFVDGVGELIGAHASRRKNGSTIPILRIEPPSWR